MSKELKALERIKGDLEYVTRLDYTDPIVRGEVRDELYKIYHRELPELDIIETALKRLETLEEEKQSFDRVTEKKLKALEIIKEKVMPLVSLEIWNGLYMVYDGELYMHTELTKEEYYLLKEVLL